MNEKTAFERLYSFFHLPEGRDSFEELIYSAENAYEEGDYAGMNDYLDKAEKLQGY